MSSNLIFEKKGNIASITLNRPETKNAVNPELAVALLHTWNEIKNDKDIRVAIITGGSSSVFSAGADLAELIPLLGKFKQPETDAEHAVLNDPNVLGAAFLRNFDPEIPVISAINGNAFGGGFEIIQGTDIRVSLNTAKFSLPEVKLALFPAGGSSVRLPIQIPRSKAMELLLTGDSIPAEEAFRLGFLNYLENSQDEVMSKSWEIAEKIANNGPLAVRAIRQAVKLNLGLTELDALDQETKISKSVFESKDAQEGPIAFFERRTPNYSGE